jgi:hypothetical protein
MSHLLLGVVHAVYLLVLGVVILLSWISFVRKIIRGRRSGRVEGTSSMMGYPPFNDLYMPYVPYMLEDFFSNFDNLDF